MFKKIKEFFTGKPAEVAVVTAPYKVPEPAATTPIPFVPAGTEATMATMVTPTATELKFVAEMSEAMHDTDKPVVAAKPARAPRVAKPKVVKEKAAPKAKAPKAAAIKAPRKSKNV